MNYETFLRDITRLSRSCLKQTWEKSDLIPFCSAEAATEKTLFLLPPSLGGWLKASQGGPPGMVGGAVLVSMAFRARIQSPDNRLRGSACQAAPFAEERRFAGCPDFTSHPEATQREGGALPSPGLEMGLLLAQL